MFSIKKKEKKVGGTERQHVSDVRVFPPLDIVFSWQRRSQCSIGAEPGSVRNVYARTEEKELLNSIRPSFSFFYAKKKIPAKACANPSYFSRELHRGNFHQRPDYHNPFSSSTRSKITQRYKIDGSRLRHGIPTAPTLSMVVSLTIEFQFH
ncbi:hypothetical protein NPIL_569801 [Nephila pilipes]|uniref:Uncharacterized protein n=1 Tax=Nephila pilipes TaxID=299642 RepID=A0A8X6QJQ1_NEPPI|nr:hypothetical protein NPIL_569801 [Nephila pilipes]